MDQKKIFNPKIWLTLFAAAHTFMFAIWALMAGFASDAEIVEWLIEDGLPTDQIVVDEMKSAMFFLGVMAISIVPPFCLLYTSPSPRDQRGSRMPSSA